MLKYLMEDEGLIVSMGVRRLLIPLFATCGVVLTVVSTIPTEDVPKGLTSLSVGAMPYETDLSETSLGLQTVQSLSLGPESEVDGSIAIRSFA